MAELESLIAGTPQLTEEYEPSSDACQFITGAAGSGKTFQTRQRIEEDPKWGTLCATTGIAAINLGAITLNSLLKYFDTASLRDRFNRGGLTSTLHQIGKKVRNLVVDEVSMMDGRQLDYIYQASLQVNEYGDMANRPLGIVLTGDFCQLPSIKAPMAFEADCWEHFERNTTKLTKIWRQDNPRFLEAINYARSGNGELCAEILQECGVKFIPAAKKGFPGTTIISKNGLVDNFNFSALLDLPGEFFGLKSVYWGQEDKIWRKHIPEVLRLKMGSYVMIRSNDSPRFTYVNGDCGWLTNKTPEGILEIKLARNDRLVFISPIVRSSTISQEDADKLEFPDPFHDEVEHVRCQKECGHSPNVPWVWGHPSYNCERGTWNVGGVKFYPLVAAYASTVHRSQGLTLDNCQVDIRDQFFGNPGMMYVALSRCRTPEGLTIVGRPDQLAERVSVDGRVRKWL